jgi:hypothetical protein
MMDSSSAQVNFTAELPYANTEYLISVQARSSFADVSNEMLWSLPSELTVKTLPDRMLLPVPLSIILIAGRLVGRINLNDSLIRCFILITGPCAPPNASLGSFSVFDVDSVTRKVAIYWSPIEPHCDNGPEVRYKIQLFNSNM